MNIRQANFQAIGTHWSIQIQEPMTDHAWMTLLRHVKHRIQIFDKAYSRFRDDSLVTRMSQKAGRYTLPADAYTMLQFYEQLYRLTDGSVTPLIGQTMVDTGYDADYSLQPKKLHKPPSWQSVLSYDQTAISVKQPVLLDFGAAGKGYLVDIVGQLIEESGVLSYVVNAGGDMRHRSPERQVLQVGLENPLDTTEAIGIVKLTNMSVCASAGSKRKWSGLHHIIDPASLQSPAHVVATWVIADDTMTADGLATALFFADAGALSQQFSFSYAILDQDMGLQYSPDFPVTLFASAQV
jgi:thiamine biosynthesis lipoprotein